MRKVNIITLGCSKNVVDSEHIMAQLAAAGWQVVFDCDTPAPVVVINTCGFIGDAKQESVDMILQCAAAKERGEIEELYVIGCLSERYRDQLREELPEVDEFFGVRRIEDVVERLVGGWNSALDTSRVITTPSHYAYLKISEGCDRTCSYCAIPMIRGPHVSVPMDKLLEETRRLAREGVKELIVIAQDTTCYGLDLYGERRLGTLLRELCCVEGIEWIRLHYAYPAGFPQDVIEAMASEPKICKYLDIPLQHISDNQLSAMRRGLGGQPTRELMHRLRREIPGIALRTTMLVGFPGETEEDFGQLLDFVREMRFERLGVFPYSAEEGTRSGETMPDDVPEQEKESRVERIMELQNEISLQNNLSRVGDTESVIVDGRQGDYVACRSQWDSPEVDTEILIPAADFARVPSPGSFIDVRITGAEQYDLYGVPVG